MSFTIRVSIHFFKLNAKVSLNLGYFGGTQLHVIYKMILTDLLTLFTDLNGFLICLLIIVLRSTFLSLFIKRYSN